MNMSLINILALITPLIPLMIGLFRFKYLDFTFKLLWFFILSTILIDLIAIIVGFLSGANLWLYNIFILINYIFFIVIFLKWQESDTVKFLLKISIPVFLLIWFVRIVFILDIKTMDTLSLTIASVIFIATAIYMLISMSKNEHILLTENARFWVLAGILLYYVGNLITFSFANFIFHHAYKLYYIHHAVTILFNLLLAKGFLCIQSQQKFGGE